MHSRTPIGAEFSSRVERTIRRRKLFRAGDTLVVALSGGADSVALLDLLAELHGYNLHLVAAHLNHCLRGVESDADEEFCRSLAFRYSIPFESRRVDVRSAASDLRLNLEDAGRRARIEFLDEICITYGAAAVALAHHADDQAETVIMRLLRGSGLTGLSGMAYRNARGYIRPLLDITRAEIVQYLMGRDLDWREDASNSDPAYLRNRIRHELLPLLEEYNPGIRRALASSASIIGEDEALLEELTTRVFAESCRMEEGRIFCSIGHLRSLHPALRSRLLRHVFKQFTGTLAGITQRHIDALGSTVDSGRPNTRLALPHGVAVVREYDRLIWIHSGDVAPEAGFELLITEPGSYQLPCGGNFTVEAAATANITTDSDSVYFDLGRTRFPWQVRSFRAGDRTIPFGMTGRKKVKDIFIDRKVPLSERPNVPLLFCDGILIWVAGVCRSESCRVDTASSSLVLVTWKKAR